MVNPAKHAMVRPKRLLERLAAVLNILLMMMSLLRLTQVLCRLTHFSLTSDSVFVLYIFFDADGRFFLPSGYTLIPWHTRSDTVVHLPQNPVVFVDVTVHNIVGNIIHAENAIL